MPRQGLKTTSLLSGGRQALRFSDEVHLQVLLKTQPFLALTSPNLVRGNPIRISSLIGHAGSRKLNLIKNRITPAVLKTLIQYSLLPLHPLFVAWLPFSTAVCLCSFERDA